MDDLKKISGIGTAVAQRLTQAGIVTYEKLATESAEAILATLSGIRGMSLERITVWQQKAAELAQAKENEAGDNGQHYAKFVVELLLDGQNKVRRTQVMAVSAGQKKASWAGWQPAKLAETVATLAKLKVTSHDDLSLRLNQWRLVGAAQSGRMLPAERPFSVQLRLEVLNANRPRRCLTTVYAKRLGTGERERLGEFAALLGKDGDTLLEIPVSALAEGDYRLEAEVALLAAAGEETAVLQGGLFQMI